MNTFDLAKAASDRRRSHSCYNKNCPRNSAGLCLIRIQLWAEQNKAAMAWNASADTSQVTVKVESGYL